MIYLVAAYVIGVLILGGFLALSLSQLRDLSARSSPRK